MRLENIGILIFGLVSLFPRNSSAKNKLFFEVDLPSPIRLLVISPIKQIDSACIVDSAGSHRVQVDYLMGNEAVLTIPDRAAKNEGLSRCKVRIFNPLTFVNPSDLKYSFYRNYFEYFKDYGYMLFHSTALMGGLTLLFFLSLIVGIITKIPGLMAYNYSVGYALFISYIQFEQTVVLSTFNHSGIAVFSLWLLFVVLALMMRYFNSLGISIEIPRYIQLRYISLLSLLFLVSAVFEWDPLLRVVQLIVIGLFFIILSIRTFFQIKEIQFHFRLLFVIGCMLLILQWLVFYFFFNTLYVLSVNTILLLFFVVFAYFISEAILQELRRNESLNKENSRLELSLGEIQISSIENEREKNARELYNNVVTRVHELAQNLDNEDLDFNLIELESTEMLNTLREYSYSLYPPYLENLQLSDILTRELEKLQFIRPATFDFDYSLKILHHRIFKLWVYRIFYEYLRINKIGPDVFGLRIQVKNDKFQGVILEIAHAYEINPNEINEDYIRDQLFTYIRYMNADFEVNKFTNCNFWRFKLEIQKNDEIGDTM